MKKILCLAVLLTISITSLLANPVNPEIAIAEFGYVDGNWQMAIVGHYTSGQPSLDNCYIKCSADSAYFNEGLTLYDNEGLLISQSDLQSILSINSAADTISFHYYTGMNNSYNTNSLRYGSINDNLLPLSELQSIHRVSVEYYMFETCNLYVLDNTPFSNENDPYSYMGTIQGYIKDEEMNPVQNATLDCFHFPYNMDPIITDSNGWFERSINASVCNLEVSYGESVTIDSTIIVLPEVNSSYDFVLPFVSGNQQVEVTPLRYDITNSPNPFNPVTTISFGRVLEQPAQVKIYNSKGGLVDELDCNSGKESISWHAGTTASGVYFYKLEIEGSEVGKGKMLLLK